MNVVKRFYGFLRRFLARSALATLPPGYEIEWFEFEYGGVFQQINGQLTFNGERVAYIYSANRGKHYYGFELDCYTWLTSFAFPNNAFDTPDIRAMLLFASDIYVKKVTGSSFYRVIEGDVPRAYTRHRERAVLPVFTCC